MSMRPPAAAPAELPLLDRAGVAISESAFRSRPTWPMRQTRAIASGAIAGCIGTVTMTAAMSALFRLLPQRQRFPLPP